MFFSSFLCRRSSLNDEVQVAIVASCFEPIEELGMGGIVDGTPKGDNGGESALFGHGVGAHLQGGHEGYRLDLWRYYFHFAFNVATQLLIVLIIGKLLAQGFVFFGGLFEQLLLVVAVAI